jgi:uncharacterized protein (DUF433 family)
MKTFNNTPKIGEGIFLLTDVANILGLPAQTVRRWLNEFWNKKFSTNNIHYSFGEKNNAVNFFTLIEFVTFAKLREQGFSAQSIQELHQILSKKLNNHPYPFASTRLFTDGIEIWRELHNELEKIGGGQQLSFKKILEPFLNKIEFDKKDIAVRYYPLGKNKSVVIDPKHQFGQPTVLGTNIKVSTIHNLYKGKETRKNICYLYNLSDKQVNDAIYYGEKMAA